MTEKKSLFAVVFEVKPNPAQSSAYLEIANELRPELLKVDGFLENERYRSAQSDGSMLSLSLWDSEKALVRWRSQKMHRKDQAKGRAGVLSDYHLRVGEVTQVTGKFADRDVGWMRHDETEAGVAKALVIIEGEIVPDGPAESIHVPERRVLQDVLTCIREHCTVDAVGFWRNRFADRCLKPPQEMARLFARHPEAVARSEEIAARCTFTLDELQYQYPKEARIPGLTPQQALEKLTWEGAARRYPDGVPDKVGNFSIMNCS